MNDYTFHRSIHNNIIGNVLRAMEQKGFKITLANDGPFQKVFTNANYTEIQTVTGYRNLFI